MSTWTDCGYLRGSWAAVGLNPRRESPSGWGPFVEIVCLVPAVAFAEGSSGRSKLGLVLTGVLPAVSRRLCLGNAMSLTHHTSGLQPATSDIGEHLLAEMTIVSRDLDYGLEPSLVSRERQSRLSSSDLPPVSWWCRQLRG